MSKFKAGDRVVFKQEGWCGRIVEIKDNGIHVVKFDDGSGDYFREDQLARNSIASTNPVVKNALNATRLAGPHEIVERVDPAARNADESTKVKVVVYVDTLFGGKHMEGTMTIGQLRAAFAKIGHARLFADVERRFDNGKGGDVNVSLPCEVYFTKA